MQKHLHIGGGKDSLSLPVADDAETVTWPVGVTDKETYRRFTLTLGDLAAPIYIHESLTPEQGLKRLVESYKAWGMYQPGGRRGET
jgi:hypothetical protein